MIKSPFLLIEHFLSPKECEEILYGIEIDTPNSDEEENSIKTLIKLPIHQARIWNRFEHFFEDVEKYFNMEIDALSPVDIEWYPEGSVQEKLRCENSINLGKRWSLVNNKDFTVIVFLKDFNNNEDFDEDFESYGGQLEFFNHRFTLNPRRGYAVIFPSNQHFLNRTLSPLYGDYFQARFHIMCPERYKYDPKNFEGNYKVWFKHLQ